MSDETTPGPGAADLIRYREELVVNEEKKVDRKWGPRVERAQVNLIVSIEELEHTMEIRLRAVRHAIERWQGEIEEDVIRQDEEAKLP